MPLVSVVMSVYNSEEFLRLAIDSILSQSFTEFEFLIADDASTDTSLTILQSYHDSRIKIVRNKTNLGLTKTLNKLIQLTNCEFIARMDADDVALPNRLLLQVEYLQKHKDISILATTIELIDADGNVLQGNPNKMCFSSSEIRRYMVRANCIAHPTIMARASVLRSNPYNESARVSQDYILWLSLLSKGYNFAKLNVLGLQYRTHAASISQQAGGSNRNRFKKILKVYSTYLQYEIRCARLSRVFFGVVFFYALFGILNIFHTLFPFVFDYYTRVRSQLPKWMQVYY